MNRIRITWNLHKNEKYSDDFRHYFISKHANFVQVLKLSWKLVVWSIFASALLCNQHISHLPLNTVTLQIILKVSCLINLLCDQHTSHLKHSHSTNYLGEKMWHMWTTQLGWIPHIYLPNAMKKNCTLWKPTNHHIFDHAYILFAPSLLKIGTIQIGSIEQGSLQAGIRHWILMGLIFDRLPLHLTSHFATDGHRKTPCLEVALNIPPIDSWHLSTSLTCWIPPSCYTALCNWPPWYQRPNMHWLSVHKHQFLTLIPSLGGFKASFQRIM